MRKEIRKVQEASLFVKPALGSSCQEVLKRESRALGISWNLLEPLGMSWQELLESLGTSWNLLECLGKSSWNLLEPLGNLLPRLLQDS